MFKLRRTIPLLIVFVLAVFNLAAKGPYRHEAKVTGPAAASANYSSVLVTRVIDGDTLVLENGERIRLIGIDTPEIHTSGKLYKDAERSGQDVDTIRSMGRKASGFVQGLIAGKRVRVEFDVGRTDRYQRLLGYVFLGTGRPADKAVDKNSGLSYVAIDGELYVFVNATIIKSGYAYPLTVAPNVKYVDFFRSLFQEARKSKRGLWA